MPIQMQTSTLLHRRTPSVFHPAFQIHSRSVHAAGKIAIAHGLLKLTKRQRSAVTEAVKSQERVLEKAHAEDLREGKSKVVAEEATEAANKDRQRGILLLNLLLSKMAEWDGTRPEGTARNNFRVEQSERENLVLICGINWVVLKESETLLDPSIFCNLRFGVASLAFWPFFKKVDKDILKAGVDVGIWAAIGYLAQAQGLLTTDASRASFISALTVLVVPMLAGLSGRGVKAMTWVSAAVAFLGVGLLEGGLSTPCVGDAWQLLSAFAFGVQIFRTELYSSKLKEGSALPLMSVVVATIAATSLLVTSAEHVPQVVHWAAHPRELVDSFSMPTWAQAGPVVWSAFMSTDLVLLIEVLSLQNVSATDASIIYTMEPVLGAGFSYILLGERWGSLGWIGAALIVCSSLITQLHDFLPHKKTQS